MLPLLLLSVVQHSCQLFQPVKCDSAVVDVRRDRVYSVVPHQTGYLIVLRTQGDQVAALYPENPLKQYPVQAGDTIVFEDESIDLMKKTDLGVLVLWSPQPIQLMPYRFYSVWSYAALSRDWQAVIARTPMGTMGEHMAAFAQAVSGPLETVARVQFFSTRSQRTPFVDVIGTGNPYPQSSGGATYPVFDYDAVTNAYDRVRYCPVTGPC